MKETWPERKKRGRPLKTEAEGLEDAFLDHALQQFMAIGYRAATVSKLVASFGSAKSTLYRKYGSKAGLLHAAMARAVRALFEPLMTVRADLDRAPKDVLREYGAIIQAYHADPGILTMWRAVSEAREDLGDLLSISLELQDAALVPIAGYLSALKGSGLLSDVDIRAATAVFADLTGGGLTAFLSDPPKGDAAIAALDFAISFFLGGVGLKTDPPSPM